MRGSFSTLTMADLVAFLRERSDEGAAALEEAAALAVRSRNERVYLQAVPDAIYKEFVAPPTVLDEPPSPLGMRSKLRELVEPIVARAKPANVADAAEAVFQHLGPSLRLKFMANMTPQIMSPKQVLDAGGASCTGLSIFFVDALRAVGIPARVAGTPYWNGKQNDGNHDWIEVYTGETCAVQGCDGWSFLEAPWDGTVTLSRPCGNWFCSPAKLGKNSGTQTYAAHFVDTGVRFPLTWNATGRAVFAERRNDYYARACGSCP